MNDDVSPSSVTPLDAAGRPVPESGADGSGRRVGVVTAVVVGFLVVLAVGSVIAWRALIGNPYSAAEAVPADADIVITIDFLQLRDLERVDRFIAAFADPMAQHGIIDAAPDLEGAMREFDDVAEEELGFRFAEEALSWIGRSGAIAIWVPDSLLDPLAVGVEDLVPTVLATLDVRDIDGAQAFLDRMLAEARDAGMDVSSTTVGGVVMHTVASGDGDPPLVVALHDERFLAADSLETLQIAVALDTDGSVAQTDDFQELAGALLGDDQLMTAYVSGAFEERMADAYVDLGLGVGDGTDDTLFRSSMGGVILDDEGALMRSASFVDEAAPTSGAGSWSAALPSGTYGFVNALLPDQFLDGVMGAYLEVLSDAGVSEDAAADFIEPADDLLGVSLLDDVLPQFGREMPFAVVPGDPTPPLDGIDVLFAIGVADPAPLQIALDNVAEALASEGIVVRRQGEVRTFELDEATSVSIQMTGDAMYVSMSTAMLDAFAAGTGGVTESPTYARVDGATIGDGLVAYVDLAAIFQQFVDDPAAGDILRPLVGVGVGADTDGDIEVSEFRVVVDY